MDRIQESYEKQNIRKLSIKERQLLDDKLCSIIEDILCEKGAMETSWIIPYVHENGFPEIRMGKMYYLLSENFNRIKYVDMAEQTGLVFYGKNPQDGVWVSNSKDYIKDMKTMANELYKISRNGNTKDQRK